MFQKTERGWINVHFHHYRRRACSLEFAVEFHLGVLATASINYIMSIGYPARQVAWLECRCITYCHPIVFTKSGSSFRRD